MLFYQQNYLSHALAEHRADSFLLETTVVLNPTLGRSVVALPAYKNKYLEFVPVRQPLIRAIYVMTLPRLQSTTVRVICFHVLYFTEKNPSCLFPN